MRNHRAPYIANFDSAAAMLRALSNHLRGEDFPMLGTMPKWSAPVMKLVASAVNRLPVALRDQIYTWSGWSEAQSAERLHRVNVERISEWTTTLYPGRKYPAVAIGSSNGAAVHLFAALGIPWLPQTFLIPVARSGVHPDEPSEGARWAQEPSRSFLEANPDIELHHMFDPNQDRLMIQRMTYFRVKRLKLGKAYETFLRQSLEPGGTLFSIECNLKWPTTRQGDRHVFQFGALGGASLEEYLHGGSRVEEYLARYNSHRKSWNPPKPDGESPEAEWGFEPQLRDDLERFAQKEGYRIIRILFDEPENMSPLVADFYRQWNEERGIAKSRLLVESFIVMEPYWTIRTGCVPFWMVFNKEPSAKALENYLEHSAPFDEIFTMLFSHGVDSIGLVPIEKWREVMGAANRRGAFLGMDENAYPRDFAVFVRYYFDLKEKIRSRYPMPSPVTLAEFDRFLREREGRYQVRFIG